VPYRQVLADPAAEALLKAIRDNAQKAKSPQLFQLAQAYAAGGIADSA
jgi:hypothetical protein